MRNRHMKKLIQNNPKGKKGSYYRLAKSKGSKSLCRRWRSLKRLSRKIDRERVQKHRRVLELMKEIEVYAPKNEEERGQLTEMTVTLRKREERYRRGIETKKALERSRVAMHRLDARLKKRALRDPPGCWDDLNEDLADWTIAVQSMSAAFGVATTTVQGIGAAFKDVTLSPE